MRINTNVPALNTQRILGNTGAEAAKSIGRLSSGFRINKAADDAAGLGIANKLRADLRSMNQAARNAEQANTLLQVAEGATSTIQNILERMKELATQSASDNTDTAGRGRINAEFTALQSEITRIVDTTKFQGELLLGSTQGSTATTANAALGAKANLFTGANWDARVEVGPNAQAGTYSVQTFGGNIRLTHESGAFQDVAKANGAGDASFSSFGVTLKLSGDYNNGADATRFTNAETFSVAITSSSGGDRNFMVSSSAEFGTSGAAGKDFIKLDGLNLALDALGIDGDNLSTAGAAREALTNIDTALDHVATELGKIGAAQNRIDYATQNVKTSIENFAAAESTIRDADMAAEMSKFTKSQILQQAGVAMLSQANSAPQLVLRLLG